MFISTINRTAKSYAIAIVGAERVLGVVPEGMHLTFLFHLSSPDYCVFYSELGTHDWNKFIIPDELKRALSAAGCDITSAMGLVVSPKFSLNRGLAFTKWGLSLSDLDVNYIVHAIKRSDPISHVK